MQSSGIIINRVDSRCEHNSIYITGMAPTGYQAFSVCTGVARYLGPSIQQALGIV